MSIENTLERIAVALEALAAKGETPAAPAAPSAPETPAAPMTPQQLNDVLVAEFKRLGSREPIDKVLTDHGVQSISDLDPSQYQSVITAVKAA